MSASAMSLAPDATRVIASSEPLAESRVTARSSVRNKSFTEATTNGAAAPSMARSSEKRMAVDAYAPPEPEARTHRSAMSDRKVVQREVVERFNMMLGLRPNGPSVRNPKFASSCSALRGELRIREDTSKFMILVWFRFRSSLERLAAGWGELLNHHTRCEGVLDATYVCLMTPAMDGPATACHYSVFW